MMRVRFCGFGGQGIVLAGYITGNAAVSDGKNAIQNQSYGSESRGGHCKSDVIVQEGHIYELELDEIDVLVGLWEDGRIGTVRGARSFQYPFGCTVYSSKGMVQTPIGGPSAYSPLLEKVVAFLQTGESPVDIEETVEVMAFLEAAGQSLDKGGQTVELP